MTDLKISQLTGATTPLAGTEVLPIVQGGATKQVSVANLTAGRTQTSNGIVQGSAATGYNFTANTPAAGMTSQLLNWYEEGTFTATLAGFSTSPTTPVTVSSRYTRIGRQVSCQIAFKNVNTTGASGAILVQGLPFGTGTDAIGIAQQSGMSGTNTAIAMLPSGSDQIELMAQTSYTNLSFTAGAGQYLFINIVYAV